MTPACPVCGRNGCQLHYQRDSRTCPHENTVDVVGCLAEGGVAEGWECRDCGYHIW